MRIDRYQSFETDLLQEFGQVIKNGTFLPTGMVSAKIVCLVDIKDHRVITISINPGPLDGTDGKLSNGETRSIYGAVSQVVPIGLEPHQGKY